MELTHKSTVKNSYDGFGESFGRVARSGKVENTSNQIPVLPESQSLFGPPPTSQGVPGHIGPGPMMYPGHGLGQSGYNNQPNWNGPYAANGTNTAFYPPPQSMYDVGPQGFGNQYQFQGSPAFQATDQMPGMSYGNANMQSGPMQFNQFPTVQNQMQIMGPAGDEDAFLVPPGTESHQNSYEGRSIPYADINRPIDKLRSGPHSPHSPVKSSVNELKTSSQNMKIMEGLVTSCCNEYGFMGPDVFFATSSVRGNIMPQEGDLVLIEAEKVEGLKFQYVAKRVQVLKLNAAPKTQLEGNGGQATVPGTIPPAPNFIKPLRNPPPPPIISKAAKSPVKSSRSRSRSRSRGRRNRGHGSRSPRPRSPPGQVIRDRSRSKTPDRRRRRRSRSRDEERRQRSRRRSKSRSRRPSHRKPTKEERSPVVKGLNIDIDTLLNDKGSNIEIVEMSKSERNLKPRLDVQRSQLQKEPERSERFRPTFVEVDNKVAAASRQSKTADHAALNIDLLDYNIWGIPELPDLKSTKDNSKEKGKIPTGTSGHKPDQSSKSKQISIKLGYMENKNKAEGSTKAPAPASSPVVRYAESPRKSNKDGTDQKTSSSSRSVKQQKSETKTKSKSDKESDKGREHRKHGESSPSSRSHGEWRRRDKDELKARQEAFEKKLSNYTEKEKRRKSPGDSSSRHQSERSSSKSTKSSRHRHEKDPEPVPRLPSPVVSLVLPPVAGGGRMERSPTPTEDEIIERERQIRLRELQLEEERILLERKMRRMGSHSRSPDVQVLTSPSPRRSRSSSRSRSPILRRRTRRSYSRSRSRSRSRGRPSRNEQLVRDLAIRHSMGSNLIDLDDFPSPERNSIGAASASYRGQSVEYGPPVARRLRESRSPLANRSRTPNDPSLVLRLGRILRNGGSFVCYVCGKKGHHGTVCWFRKPGVSYPEDDEPI